MDEEARGPSIGPTGFSQASEPGEVWIERGIPIFAGSYPMNAPKPNRSQANDRRKEPRYKTSSEQRLRCRTAIDEPGKDQIWEGTTVDISPSGMRLLSEGDFQVGQPIWTELKTTRSHGIYRGNVRRIEPWVAGQLILGCSLRDAIPNEVLQELASEGVINRRADGRFSIDIPGTISWPLSPEEIPVKIQDYSSGGMKLHSEERIPEQTRLRLRFEASGQEVTLEAKSAWSRQADQGWITGVGLVERDAPTIVAETLGREAQTEPAGTSKSGAGTTRQIFTVAAFLALCGYLVFAAF